MWTQPYTLLGLGQGLSAIVAALPILVVFLLLGVVRKPAWVAGTCGLIISLLVAVAACHMPVEVAVGASTYGFALVCFLSYGFVFWALALFRVTSETGRFEVIRESISELTSDPRHQALLIAFGLEAFFRGRGRVRNTGRDCGIYAGRPRFFSSAGGDHWSPRQYSPCGVRLDGNSCYHTRSRHWPASPFAQRRRSRNCAPRWL